MFKAGVRIRVMVGVRVSAIELGLGSRLGLNSKPFLMLALGYGPGSAMWEATARNPCLPSALLEHWVGSQAFYLHCARIRVLRDEITVEVKIWLPAL